MGNRMLHHLEIYVSDLDKSVGFWGWLLTELGYEQYQKWESGISWKHQETYLVFVQADERFLDVPYHRCRVGLNHLAFHAKSREHVDEMTEALIEKGIPILYQNKHPYAGGNEYYAVYFEDPDRIKVELVAPSIKKGNF
ncbi:VOC family protein [Neobacillus niacini]|uniref:VOC family protein n=1 Tax=Neobacillus niacini TaxID=86668 RepID=UPI0005EED9DA|nr:VOC family protein [Neobacillus niacini]